MKKIRKTTVGIDEDLIYKLKFLALKKRTTLTKLLGEALEIGFNDLAKKFHRENEKSKTNLLPNVEQDKVNKIENLVDDEAPKINAVKNEDEKIMDRFR